MRTGVILGLVAVVLLGPLPTGTIATPHPLSVLRQPVATTLFAARCIVPEGLGNLLAVTTMGNIVVRAWDRNYDGQKDAETYSELIGGPNRERPFPFKFIFDLDFDGTPDTKYLDIAGDGRCEDMKKYPMTPQQES